ncbi:MAG: hypothetical protein KA715_04500 [Xanthomonadaceae bacterium]|nr:hypothetical protein [Xanthomonadaceae bacterium]
MKHLKYTLWIMLFSLSSNAVPVPAEGSRLTGDQTELQADKRQLTIYPGEEKIIDIKFKLDDMKFVKVGNPKILGVDLIMGADNKRQLIFKPTDKGECRVIVRDDQLNTKIIFDVRIVDADLNRLIADLKELLKDIEGVNLSIKFGKIVVDGDVVVPADYGRLNAILSDGTLKSRVINMVTLSPLALQFLAKRIQEDINKTFGPALTTRVVNSQIWLEGTVKTDPDAQRAYKTALLYLPETKVPTNLAEKDPTIAKVDPKDHPLVRSFLTVFDPDAANANIPPPPPPPPSMIRVTAHFVELTKDYIKDFGFKWKPAFTSNPQINMGTGGAASSTFSATLSSLIPKLWSFQKAGFGKVLKTVSVITKSGAAGTVDNTVNIPIPGPSGAVQYTPVTLSMNITPTVNGELIELDGSVKLSNVIGNNNGSPINSENNISTKVDVKSGESVAIGNIDSMSLTTNFNPGQGTDAAQAATGAVAGGETQALFDLERSRKLGKLNSEFVVFLTPETFDDAAKATESQTKNFRVRVK